MTVWVLILIAITMLVPTPLGAVPAGQRFIIVPAESQVTYRVNETLFREGNRVNVAVGTTSAIKGEVVLDRTAPRNSRLGPITIDISTFRSDSARRDQAIRERWLESSRFPVAEFRATALDGLPAAVREGGEVRMRVRGDLKIRDVVRPVAFEVTLTLQGTTLRGSAEGAIRMTDFGFDPPSILGILRAENEVRLELRFIARPAP